MLSAAYLDRVSLSVLAEQLTQHKHCLLIVRHGQTAWNAEDRLTTRSDIPLSVRGEQQALELAGALEGVRFERAFCSPLARARETAQIALGERELELACDARLVEPDAGPFEGQRFSELRAGDSALAVAYRRCTAERNPVYPAGAETVAEAAARISGFLDQMAALPGRTFAASHATLIRIAALAFLGQDPAYYHRLKIGNCHALLIKHYPQPPHQLVGLNLPPR